jgi:uncharacterized membrane protein (DUF485 family)
MLRYQGEQRRLEKKRRRMVAKKNVMIGLRVPVKWLRLLYRVRRFRLRKLLQRTITCAIIVLRLKKVVDLIRTNAQIRLAKTKRNQLKHLKSKMRHQKERQDTAKETEELENMRCDKNNLLDQAFTLVHVLRYYTLLLSTFFEAFMHTQFVGKDTKSINIQMAIVQLLMKHIITPTENKTCAQFCTNLDETKHAVERHFKKFVGFLWRHVAYYASINDYFVAYCELLTKLYSLIAGKKLDMRIVFGTERYTSSMICFQLNVPNHIFQRNADPSPHVEQWYLQESNQVTRKHETLSNYIEKQFSTKPQLAILTRNSYCAIETCAEYAMKGRLWCEEHCPEEEQL